MGIKILKLAGVEERTGKKKSSIYQAVKDGSFPEPVSLGGRARGWIEHEIDEWIETQMRKRHKPAGGAADN